MLGMAKKDKGSQPQGRSPHYTVYGRLPPKLGKALEEYIAQTRPRPTTTSVLILAIEELLAAKGFWERGASAEEN